MTSDEAPEDPMAVPAAVGVLLEKRETVRTWLNRLAEWDDEAAPEVYQSVAEDYRERLAKVERKLAEQRSELDEALLEATEEKEALAAALKEARRSRAEAELRHRVGELDDDEWTETQEEHDDRIEDLANDVERASEAVAALEEVVSAVADSAEAVTVGKERGEEGAEDGKAPEERKQAKAEEERSRDELEFLESLSVDDSSDREADDSGAEDEGGAKN